jgi:hypothetical protein
MKAMPLSAGSAVSSFLHASRPPAEAPIATIGKSAWLLAESGFRIQRGRSALICCGRLPGIRITFLVERNSKGTLEYFIAQGVNHCDAFKAADLATTWRRAPRV